MVRISRWFGLLLLVLTLPLLAAEQDKGDKPDPKDDPKAAMKKEDPNAPGMKKDDPKAAMKKNEPTKDEPKPDAPSAPSSPIQATPSLEAKYKKMGQVQASIVSVNSKDNTIVIEVKQPVSYMPTSGRSRKPQTKMQGHEYEVTIAEEAHVRATKPPEQFDDKNAPKKYTAEELRKLKGTNSKLPGYESSLSELAKGQKVLLELSKLKSDSGKKPVIANGGGTAAKGKTKAAAKGKDDAEEPKSKVDELEGIFATLIVIEVPEKPATPTKGKK